MHLAISLVDIHTRTNILRRRGSVTCHAAGLALEVNVVPLLIDSL